MNNWISTPIAVMMVAVALILGGVPGCSESSVSPDDTEDTFAAYTDTIFIVNRDGKKWDITQAVVHFDMDSAGFIYGDGGPRTLPTLDPQFSVKGDSVYPGNSAVFQPFGTTIDGENRPYPVKAIGQHEVVDDRFRPTHVVVAY